MAEITSAYEALGALDWDDVHDASDLLTDAVKERAAESKVRQLIFQEEETPGLAVSWRQDVPSGSDDEVEALAEFAESPVIDPSKAPELVAKIDARGVAARVSYEQTKFNGGKAVQREINHLLNTVQRGESSDALAVLAEGVAESDPRKKVETYTFSDPVTSPDTDVLSGLLAANELIMTANIDGIQFGYKGDLLWANPVTAMRIVTHKTIRDLYVGNIASENPIFQGDLGVVAGQWSVLPDPALPLGEAYMLQAGDVDGSSIGTEFVWEDGHAFLSGFYPDGEPVRGGKTRSFRADYSKWSKMGLRAPKSIVKLAGLV
ncbi:phage major capsid protein [Corynebacterium cystitidis]|uniref:phage major capsid protein n=1 Tax=Corynebacterium cystitidis TaxID=35757 RepID=UPI00211DC76B|nr:hypothetical protein [Corynebacterium cystitidis]